MQTVFNLKRGLLFIGLSMLSACSGTFGEDIEEEEEATVDFLTDKQALIDAKQSLMDLPKFKGKEVMVFQGFFISQDGEFEIELQDPENLDNIDSYSYNEGIWSSPVPVQIFGSGDMSYNLTPLKDLRFDVIPDMVKIYEEKVVGIEGADPHLSDIHFHLWVPSQTRYWSAGFIEGTREEYTLDFNLDGTIKEFEKR